MLAKTESLSKSVDSETFNCGIKYKMLQIFNSILVAFESRK